MDVCRFLCVAPGCKVLAGQQLSAGRGEPVRSISEDRAQDVVLRRTSLSLQHGVDCTETIYHNVHTLFFVLDTVGCPL